MRFRSEKEKNFPWRIFYRVALIQSALVLASLATSGMAARYFFKRQFIQQAKTQLQDALLLLSHPVAQSPDAVYNEHWCNAHAKTTALRFSLILSSGRVLCDSRENASALENQADRPEVLAAFRPSAAKGIHFTLDSEDETLYGTVVIEPQAMILRGAVALTRLSQTMQVFDTSLGLSLFFAAVALGVLAFWSARRLVFPLGRLLVKTREVLSTQAEGGVREDLSQEAFDEWLDLESNIDDIRRDLAAKTQSLSMEQVELETIMGSISDAILAVDPEGNPLFFNSRFELVFGKEGLRQRHVKLWAIFREPEILNGFQSALKEGRSTDTKAIPLDQKDGPRRFFSLSVSPLRNKEGSIYGAVGIFHDVTELKTAEQMRIDFVANVSHELRTPLTVIKGYADTLILDSKPDSPNLEYLNSIARNSDRLMNLMNDLLDLSSIESDSIIQKDALSTEEVTFRIVRQLQGAFDAKEQVVKTNCGARTVVADTPRLEQVLVNLLGNANKYTPRGGQITISWEPEGENVLLKVSDTGPGIPVEHHARLFERFYRIDKARSREQGGTGLGLAIVKHIMQRHEGSVWVESSPGLGSTFYCRFPGGGPTRAGQTASA
jgi:two-component system phosphate regulon sensor histidine kinase PhoR